MGKDKDKKLEDQIREDIFNDDPVVEKTNKKEKIDYEALTKSLKEENEKLTKDKEDLNTKYLMSLAEQKNYKKRLDEEMDRFYKYSTFDMCKELIGILDNFDLALDKKVSDEINAYLNGFRLTRNQIYKILEKQGVTEIDALGKEFDPNLMVSLSHIEDKTKKDQEVTNVFMKGYMYKDRVLRPANVVINLLPEEETSEPQDEETKEE